MDNPFKSPAVLSFCPGILGIERGLKRAGVDLHVMAYVEIEAFIIANLVAGMEAGMVDPAPIWTDAKTFDARPFCGKLHAIIGGYPCPGESLAGLREGHLYKGFIWPSIRRAIAATRPVWCFFENVDDHLTGTFPIVLRSLHNMGYAVEAGIFSAEEVGASHERQRLFILAVANSYMQWWKRGYREIQDEAKSNEAASWRKRVWNEFKNCSEKMANSCSPRLQGMQSGLVPRKGQRVSGPIAECRPQDFPMPQGSEQWEWEDPREIESSLEYTANGYNFESDLLRAAGNSVVEQTAALAFKTLLNKFL